MGDNTGNPGREDAMSTSGESVNQHLARHPSGEGIGGGLVPQESGLPASNTQWLVVAEGPRVADSVPDNRALVGPLEGPLVVGSGLQQDPRYMAGSYCLPVADSGRVQGSFIGGSVGTQAAASVAATASAVT